MGIATNNSFLIRKEIGWLKRIQTSLFKSEINSLLALCVTMKAEVQQNFILIRKERIQTSPVKLFSWQEGEFSELAKTNIGNNQKS
jgi:hypothetical protein